MTPFNPAVYEDPKIKEVLEMLAAGSDKEKIVEHFGHKNWKSIDMYFRRKGFRWNKTTFDPIPELATSAVDESRFIHTKAAHVVRQLSVKHADIRQIAIKNGFQNVGELGEYMKANGYVWDTVLNNYEYDVTTVQKEDTAPNLSVFDVVGTENDEIQQLVRFLLSKKHRLVELLETENNGTLPRYTFKGGKTNKTLGLPSSVQTLLHDFSTEFNVTQRAIIEISLAEFFKKYGYAEQLNQVLLE
ncbi:hypothetical protein [Sporosarcina ureae]|uniref:hypothetical protein n=1 Tax=Sporosarcina ureae TaxID=1571 RepID=UPI000A17D4B1|nr:hypothetical protein [Sporosarcina ureae]ARK22265.1 hypothetical protein SporoP32a_12450 [Sporosarcina ureae]